MKRDATKDVAVSFAVIMTMISLWQIIEGQKAQVEGKRLESKINRILKKVGG
jgi:hypothetical protein